MDSIEEKLRHIGVNITGGRSRKNSEPLWIDIEKTIYEATLVAGGDARIFLVLCSWVKVHGEYVITEKLMKLQKEEKSVWLIALAIFAVSEGLHKWSRLIEKVDGEHSLTSIKIAQASIDYKGPEKHFIDAGFLIAKGSLRVREGDVRTIEDLIKANGQYRNRFLYGANYRADIIHAIEQGIENPYQIAKLVGCSYHPAHRIFNEYKLVKENQSA